MAGCDFGIVLIGYLAIRFLFAVCGWYDVGSRIQVFFWFGFVLWLCVCGIVQATKVLARKATQFPSGS